MNKKKYVNMFYPCSDEFTTYESDLIKKRINPKICVMSTADWMYLSRLRDTHYANITVMGCDPKLINELDMLKDYDIIILDTDKPFMESMLYGITDVAGVINSRYEKEVSLVYSFKKDDKKIASQQFVDEQGLHDAGFVDGTCDLRNMIDNSYKVLINKNQKKKDKQKKKSK